MRLNRIIVLGSGVVLSVVLPLAAYAAADVATTTDYVPGEVLVEWNTSVQSNTSLADRVSIIPVSDVEQAVAVLQLDSHIKQVEPNYKRYLFVTPDDTYFSSQLHLEQSTDADIDIATAWDTTTGDRSIVVAVIDSGIDLDHPDLVDNIWINSDEIADNGIDDDENGYIDDVNGWDFIDNDNDPNSTPDSVSPNDTYVLHGTHVSGIIGATGNNGQGVAGINWEVSLMPLRIFGDDGASDIGAILDAIAYAEANGATILNMSYGSPYASSLEEDAMAEAYTAGLLSVAAAGNNSENLNTTPYYPVCYDDVIGVAAVDSTDAAASFTNYGADCVDLAAPGDNILSTFYYDSTSDYTEPYGYFSGTSMATPVIVGVAALLKAVEPTLDSATLTDLLVNSTDVLADTTLGSGRVNAATALDLLSSAGPGAVAISAYHSDKRHTKISAQIRTRDSTPYFYWPKPTSVEDIAGYYLYFGRDRVDPTTDGNLQTSRIFEPSVHGNETNYRLRICTLDATGVTSPITQFEYLVDTKIKRPTWQSVQPTDQGVYLRWYKPKHEHTLGYYVYRSTKKNGSFTKISSSLLGSKKYTDSSVQAGRNYYYKVRAVDDLGNESQLSEAKRIKL
ncbi:MAG: peptidase S8/S53 subtilisin kexin sedolisin [uncultured bacterium]|nr:MAG: peptidase S8/S53 subtilisin kexin sedolisin [uncultured bacterium]